MIAIRYSRNGMSYSNLKRENGKSSGWQHHGFALGAISMVRRGSRGLAMTAAILAMVPGLSCCCIAGLPLGIWSLIVLNNPDVKSSFQSHTQQEQPTTA